MITQVELQKVEALRGQKATLTKALKELEDDIKERLQAGEAVNAGNLTAEVARTARVNPAWKEIALSLGADEDAVRAATIPSVAYTLVVEMSEAKAMRAIA